MAFAENSPFPAPDSLYEDVYVLDDEVRGWYSLQSADRGAGLQAQAAAPGAAEHAAPSAPGAADDEIPRQLTDALAAGEDRERQEAP